METETHISNLKEKVTIHYLWFENYLCFKKQGINLSKKFTFDYNPKTNTVSFQNNHQEYIDNFFESNIDLTAIVGENGVGKTSLLRFVLELRNGSLIETPCVIVCECGCNFYAIKYSIKEGIMSGESIRIKGKTYHEIAFSTITQQKFPFSDRIRFIYMTEMFSESQYCDSLEGGDDLSFASLLYHQTVFGEEEDHIDNPITKYLHKIMDWQLAFFSNGEKYVQKFQIHYPPIFSIRLNYDKNAFTKMYLQIHHSNDSLTENEIKTEAQKIERSFLHNRDISEGIADYKNHFATAIFMNIISSIKFVISMSKNEGAQIIELMKQIKDANNAWDNVYMLLEKIKENNDSFDKLLKTRDFESMKVVNSISIDAKAYMNFMDYFLKFIESQKDYNTFLTDEIIISTHNIDLIKEFFNSYKKCVRIVDFFSFSWHLSSGEMLLLNQYAKLTHLLKKAENGSYYLPKSVNDESRAINTIIMLDEAEVAFHPEWQRIYLDAFLYYIKENIANAGTHIQVLIATHSPIILSDIPKQNTVAMRRGSDGTAIIVENEETFAANVFSLFKNSFFINEAGVGEFAFKKLEWIINQIHNGLSSKDTILKYITAIGDPYLKDKLIEEFNRVYDTREDLERLKKEKALLDERIARLESEDVS